MKQLGLFCCLLWMLPFAKVSCQTHIYERYASHSELEVAYLENIALDDSNAINATIIIAKDSASWSWLTETFHIQTGNETNNDNQRKISIRLCDKEFPESLTHGTVPESYLLWVNHNTSTIIICQYSTMSQYNKIHSLIIKKLSNEKD